jgi:hypothetical protein
LTAVAAVRIRHLLLAACATEVSYGEVDPDADAARVLLVLTDARDASPVTHGTDPDPDATVEAAEHPVTPFGGITDVLVRLRQALLAELSRELVERQRIGGPTGPQ